VTVFLDTVGLLSIWDKSDQWHSVAQACFAKLLAVRADLDTSSFVMLECGNAAARRPYRSAVNRLCLQLESRHSLILPTTTDWQAAWQAYGKGDAESAGIVD
jgi:predicted nucleic acid-binding protein